MRAIDPELQARLDGGATTLCRCWRVRRRDGVELGFTDHDVDLSFGGLTYRASSGMDASAIQAATGLSVDNAQAMGALTAAAVREEDVAAGRYDGAEIWHWLVDWERPELRVLMFRGSFGEIRRADGAFEVELRGLAEALNAPVGRTLMRTCDRALGDGRCGFDTEQARVRRRGRGRGGERGRGLAVSGLGGFAEGWFEHGMLTWLSGENAGDDGDGQGGPARSTAVGGGCGSGWRRGGRLRSGTGSGSSAGCDKRAGTCRGKFDNFLNFRGFPHIPGDDWVTAYPKDGAVHDGASLERRVTARWSCAGAGVDRHALPAPGELPRRGDRLPRAAARPLARDAGRRAGGGAGLHRGLVGAERRRGPAGGGGAAPRRRLRPARRGRATSSCCGCARAGSPSTSACWRASPLGHPTLIHAYSGHGVVESPLTPAWSRRIAGVFRFPERSR